MYFKLGDYYHLSEYYYEKVGGSRKHPGAYAGDCYCAVFRLLDAQVTSNEIGGTIPLHQAALGNLTMKEIRLTFRCKSCSTEIQASTHAGGFEYLSALRLIKIIDPWYKMFLPMVTQAKERDPNLLFKMKKG